MGMNKTNVVVFGGAIEVTDKGEEFPIPQRWEHEVKKESDPETWTWGKDIMTLQSYCYLGTPLSAMLGNYGRESIDVDEKSRGENHC